jgi:hypothetical protein
MFNFKNELEGVVFDFHTMHVKKLQLFQVYMTYEGRQHRFHMQRQGQADFYMTDPHKVPEPFRHLEKALSEAIFEQARQVPG